MGGIRVILVGAGQMGGALLTGWKQAGDIEVIAVDPNGKGKGVVTSADAIPAGFTPDVIVLAVKPQVMAQVAPAYAKYTGALFLSIAAGTPIKAIANFVGKKAAIVRTMPNLPATIGQGVTVAVPNKQVSKAQRAQADKLLATAGAVHWLKDEKLMDAVVAISGSGPAYLFHFAEALAEAGRKAGLPAKLSDALSRQTICGSAALLQHSKKTPELLRESVTSKGGTTEAALKILMGQKGLGDLLKRAVEAAKRRSVELSK